MRERLDRLVATAAVVHPHRWLWEPLETDRTFMLRSMFGAKAVYLDGRLMLCFCAGKEPWCGVLVCTERAHHAALQAELGALTPHPILPKWLYLSEDAAGFDRIASRLVDLARQRDPRLGVEPGARKKSAGKRPRPVRRRRRTKP